METQRRVLSDITPTVLMKLKEKAPIKSGRFRDSIGYRFQTSATSASVHFVSTSPYARYIIEGTQSGKLIEPVTEGIQSLRWADSGGYIFATSVIRGSTEPNDFARQVAVELKPYIEHVLQNAVVVVSS